MTKINLLNLTQEELKQNILNIGFPSFVANQILDWLYKKNVYDFQLMANIAKANREKLAENFTIQNWQTLETLTSEDELAKKYIITLEDGKKIESVLLRERKYNTLCISSQIGCSLNCKFCLTGQMGFKRNLSAGEIIAQVLIAQADGEEVSHLVFMGMGEPFSNYDNVMKAIKILNADYGFNIGKRKITVSTNGVIKGMEQLLKEENPTLNLALSVGSADPLQRIALMPNEHKNPLLEIIKLLKQYQKLHNRKLTLEYTVIKGKNDSSHEISELINLARYLKAKINLINFNPHPSLPFEAVSGKEICAIRDQIVDNGLDVTIRYKKGLDIGAACGQLGGS